MTAPQDFRAEIEAVTESKELLRRMFLEPHVHSISESGRAYTGKCIARLAEKRLLEKAIPFLHAALTRLDLLDSALASANDELRKRGFSGTLMESDHEARLAVALTRLDHLERERDAFWGRQFPVQDPRGQVPHLLDLWSAAERLISVIAPLNDDAITAEGKGLRKAVHALREAEMP